MNKRSPLAKLTVELNRHLDNAFHAPTLGDCRFHLCCAMSAVQRLKDAGKLNEGHEKLVNETKLALAARGWC